MNTTPDSPAPRRRPSAPRIRPTASANADTELQPPLHATEPELAPDAARLPAVTPAQLPAATPTPATLDAHGHNPADYQWLPVRRRARKDGFTVQRQQDFIACLAETGCVQRAADEVGMTVQSCYRLRRSPGGENFAAAWDVALHHAARLLLDVAFERAFNGTDEPVFDKSGQRVGRRMRQNDRLMMFLLRAYMPERFRHAHRDWRAPDEPLLPAPPAMAQMIERLAPEAPEEPQALLAPDELEDALHVADALPAGELPHWHRGRGDAEPGGHVPPPELDEAVTRMIHGTGNDPKFDRVDGPRVR